MIDALAVLGSVGIAPDEVTMEYFRLPEKLATGAPFSSHENKKLIPNRNKLRSLMDMEVPNDLREDFSLIDDIQYRRTFKVDIFDEPFHESGDNEFSDIVLSLKQTMIENVIEEDIEDQEELIDEFDKEDIESTSNGSLVVLIDDFSQIKSGVVSEKDFTSKHNAYDIDTEELRYKLAMKSRRSVSSNDVKRKIKAVDRSNPSRIKLKENIINKPKSLTSKYK